MNLIIPHPGDDLLDLALRCNALYICPKKDGVRLGPLVPYVGKDEQKRNLVGDIYFNFRRIEPHTAVVYAYAMKAYEKIRDKDLLDSFDTICGIPKGGQTFGQMLAFIARKKFTYAVKKERPIEVGKKQESEWDLSEFEFEKGERVAVTEDVFNNFNNTSDVLDKIAGRGADVKLLVGALNRSPKFSDVYIPSRGVYSGIELSVVASVREPYPEYNQDDPEVAEDIKAGNIEWNVKPNWARLRAIMDEHKQ